MLLSNQKGAQKMKMLKNANYLLFSNVFFFILFKYI